MVMKSAYHGQIMIIIKSNLKVARTCSLTRRMDGSQLQSLKFGQSKNWKNENTERNTEKDTERKTENENRENTERAQRHRQSQYI
jgi:hypothetical protein